MRRLLLDEPERVGTMSPDILNAIPDGFFTTVNTSLDMTPSTELETALEHFAETIGTSVARAEFTLDNSPVKAGTPQRFRGWHIDHSTQYVTATTPTEFLVGSLRITREFKDLYHKRRLTNIYGRLANKFDDKSDRELGKLGLSVWQADPYEIVKFGPNVIHRSPVNEKPHTIDRTFLLVRS